MKHIENVEWRNGWASFRVNIDGKDKWVAMGLQEADADLVAEVANKWRQVVRIERLRRRCAAAGMPAPAPTDAALLAKLGLLQQREDLASLPEIIAAYRADSDGRAIKARSVENAISSLLLIIRTARGDAATMGSSSILSEQLFTDYEAAKIRAAKPEGPAAVQAALTTAASTINQAKSVFCAEALRGATMRQLRLPDLEAFRAFRPQGTTRKIRVEVDDETLARLRTASDELWFTDPARWLAFALCCGIGLRRGEAKRARWDWVRQVGGKWVMYLVTTDQGAPKGNEHKKEIELSLWQDMCAVRAASSDHVLPGATDEERDRVLEANVQWLRSLGIDADKPNHELRAIYLQALDRAHGREAAQLGAGHGDVRTTEIYTGRGTAPAVRPL